MVLRIEPDTETAARIEAAADRLGIAPEPYAARILRESTPPPGSGFLVPGDMDELSRIMRDNSENLPILPAEATERSTYFQD